MYFFLLFFNYAGPPLSKNGGEKTASDQSVTSYLDRYDRHDTEDDHNDNDESSANRRKEKPVTLWKIRLPTRNNKDDPRQKTPTIHIIDDSHLNSGPSVSITRRSPFESVGDSRGYQKDESEWVFNIVIKQQRKQRAAFIAPDVSWLRDLVPHVVDVIDQSERRIKETVFSALDEHQSDRQVYVNVVKSSILSENEVAQILDRLRDLMWNGGSGVQQLKAENREGVEQQRILVLNIIIFNIISSEPVEDAELPAGRDSYLEALEESRKSNPPVHQPHGPFFNTHKAPAFQSGVGGSFNDKFHNNHEIPVVSHRDYHKYNHYSDAANNKGDSESYHSQSRPLAVMEQDYLTSVESEPELPAPPLAANVAEVQDTFKDGPHPASVFFTSLADQQNNPLLQTEAVVAESTSSVGSSVGATSTTTGTRNRLKTIGFVAVPLVAGLASTMGMWLPAVAALGKKRKRRSIINDRSAPRDRTDEGKAIEEKYLALLMGQRYANASKESLQETIDNWKYRDRQASTISPSKSSGLFSTSRPWRVTRPEMSQQRSSTVKRSTDGVPSVTESSASTSEASESPPPFPVTDADSQVEERHIGSIPPSTHSSNYHVLPVSSSDDFDIVANFVKSTLSKMVDGSDGEMLDSDVFVINSATMVDNRTAVVISAEGGSTQEPPTNEQSYGGGTLSLSSFNVFTADPITPDGNITESVTNSPITYVSIKPIMINPPLPPPPPASQQSAQTTSRTYSDLTTMPTTLLTDEYYAFNDESATQVEFYDEDTGQVYTAQEVPIPTVPYSEPYLKATSRPLPDGLYVDPYELPNGLKPIARNRSALPTTTSTTTMRPTTLITIQNFIQTHSIPPPVDVDSSSSNVFTSLKFTHGGIPTTAPLKDYSTVDGESALVSDIVTNQMILANLLKGASSATMVPTTSPKPSSTSKRPSTTSPKPITTSMRPPPINKRPSFPSRPLGEISYLPWDFTGSHSAYVSSSTYSPLSTSTVLSEVDVSGLIDQLSSNFTTGVVTTSPHSGIHFVNTSTELIFLSPFDATPPSTLIDLDLDNSPINNRPPLSIEAVVAETDSGSSSGDSPVVGSGLLTGTSLFVSSSSGDSGSSSSSSSSSSLSSGGTSSTTSTSTTLGSGVVIGMLAVATAAAAYVAAAFLPGFGLAKRRRTYAPARKKQSFGEPPSSYEEDLTDTVSPYRRKQSFAEPPPNYNDPGSLEDDTLYGPPATIYLKARRRRRSLLHKFRH